MGEFNPIRQMAEHVKAMEKQAERERLKTHRQIARAIKHRAFATKYLDSEHWYQMMVNGKPEGDLVKMQGEEAKTQNTIFQERYRAEINKAIDEGKPFGQTGAVSRRWKLANPPSKEETSDD